jgi:ankyrin repeat protein
MAASSLGMLDLVRKLIECGAKVNDENDKGSDALYAACVGGHLEVVELLLESGADVNAKGKPSHPYNCYTRSDSSKVGSTETL